MSSTHADHYIQLRAVNGETVAWWDGFTGLTVVVARVGLGISGEIGATHLVSVIDRQCQQTFAWAFHADSSAQYISEKIPRKVFDKFWRQRLAQSIHIALRLHDQAAGATAAHTA